MTERSFVLHTLRRLYMHVYIALTCKPEMQKIVNITLYTLPVTTSNRAHWATWWNTNHPTHPPPPHTHTHGFWNQSLGTWWADSTNPAAQITSKVLNPVEIWSCSNMLEVGGAMCFTAHSELNFLLHTHTLVGDLKPLSRNDLHNTCNHV